MADVAAVIARVDALGAPFRVRAVVGAPDAGNSPSAGASPGFHDDDTAVVSSTWFAAAELADPASDEALRMVGTHAASRGMPVGRHAASLAFQRYCHRLCGVAAASWLLEDTALDLQARNVSVRFVEGTPDLVALDRAAGTVGAGADELLGIVLDHHLLPLARTLAGETGPGLGNLTGNMAAGFAGALRILSLHPELGLDAYALLPRAQELLNTKPELRRGGEFRVLDGPRGPRLQYDRRSCCHWYAAPDGRFCSWCSRLSHDERTCRFVDAMAEE